MLDGPALYPLAFAAGALSFLSPCVLPLVPGYISYMSGVGEGLGESAEDRTRAPVVAALLFVAGFTMVFVPLGATASVLGSFLDDHRLLLTRVGGVFIIFMGLVFLGVVRIPALYREARFHPTPGAGAGGSVLLGAAFAFGWSPCIGPILGAALTLAAGHNPARGAFLLLLYSLGLGIPFVLSGLGVARLTGAIAAIRRHTRVLMTASGVLLIVMGVLYLTDSMFRLSLVIQRGFDAVGLDFLARI